MEHELTCCVCLELYVKPLLLPCGHNFCRKCILGLIQHAGGQGVIRRTFTCPKCRREISLEGSRLRGVDNLPGNQVLDNIVKVYKNEKETLPPSLPSSKLCSSHCKPRTLYCHTCSKLVCEECIMITHASFGHVVRDTTEFIEEEKVKDKLLINTLSVLSI